MSVLWEFSAGFSAHRPALSQARGPDGRLLHVRGTPSDPRSFSPLCPPQTLSWWRCEERLRRSGGDDPIPECLRSCQGVANKRQIYVHFERSISTIGFPSGAVARERRAGRAETREQPGRVFPSVGRERRRGQARTRTHTRAPRGFEPRRPSPPEGAPGRVL